MSCIKRRGGFTLMEVLIAVAITGLVVSAGYRLLAISLKALAEVQGERELVAAAQKVWLRFQFDKEMPDSGKERFVFGDGAKDDEPIIAWKTEDDSVSIGDGDYELKFKRVTVSVNNRSMIIYLPAAMLGK